MNKKLRSPASSLRSATILQSPVSSLPSPASDLPSPASRLPPATRCAIYTRKSTEDGLEQEYNSLDAQRDAGEAYVKSQKHEGWTCLETHYDDGGFTGANMERPALQRLLEDIEAGKIDCVVVYKVDRLSRSLLDFARIMETFDRSRVSFVSVTQAFNTGSSMGRLILNVLLSFAQFEREMISERTRDKIAAARRKGKWSGGMPVLGYTVENTKLVIDEDEAARVREIFRLYLEHRSIVTVSRILNERGWTTKRWTTRKGVHRGGRLFDKTSVYKVLTSVIYIGKISYKEEVHEGEHQGIIDADVFAEVGRLLAKNGKSSGATIRNKYNALLRGRLRCAACDCGMSHTYSKKGTRVYRYYVCQQAQNKGWRECPSPSLSAGDIEQFVVDQIKGLQMKPAVVRDLLAQVRMQDRIREPGNGKKARGERRSRSPAQAGSSNDAATPLSADARPTPASRRRPPGSSLQTTGSDATADLQDFGSLWDSLQDREQVRLIELLIDQITYDGREGRLSITYRPSGVRPLALETSTGTEEAA